MASITAAAEPQPQQLRNEHRSRHVDLVLFSLPLAISALGLLMIYDASKGKLARAG